MLTRPKDELRGLLFGRPLLARERLQPEALANDLNACLRRAMLILAEDVGECDALDQARLECNLWVMVVVLDIHLLAYEFNTTNTQVHMLQTAALVTVAIPAITMILFTLLHYLSSDRPFSSDPDRDDKQARTLPPFATALISGGLRTTLIFTVVILILNAQTLGAETSVVKIVVAQVCLKSFGSAMALANQRLQMFTTDVM